VKILLTGSGGYLGGRLANYLSEINGFEVFLLSANLAEKKANINIRKVDWSDERNLIEISKDMDCIIHAAGMNANNCQNSITNALEFNVMASDRLINAALKNKVSKFIYLSSAHIYGDLSGHINEESSKNPIHPYGVTKKMAENLLQYYASQNANFEFLIFRLSNVIGYPLKNNQTAWDLLVNDLCNQALKNKTIILKGNGNQVRDFLTMKDLFNAIVHSLKFERFNNQIYNLSSGSSMTVSCMAGLIMERYKLLYDEDLELQINKNDETKICPLYLDNSKFLSTNFRFTNNFSAEIDLILKNYG
jgi:UDP-glucose 4-epimerase